MSLDLFDAVYIRATRTKISPLLISTMKQLIQAKWQLIIKLYSSWQTVVYFKIVCKYHYIKFCRRLMNRQKNQSSKKPIRNRMDFPFRYVCQLIQLKRMLRLKLLLMIQLMIPLCQILRQKIQQILRLMLQIRQQLIHLLRQLTQLQHLMILVLLQ